MIFIANICIHHIIVSNLGAVCIIHIPCRGIVSTAASLFVFIQDPSAIEHWVRRTIVVMLGTGLVKPGFTLVTLCLVIVL